MTSFDDAVRRLLGAPPEAIVSSEWQHAGDDGCDTCGYGRTPSAIIVSAYLYYRTPSGRLNPNKNQGWHREFYDLPELWDALFPEDADAES